MAKTQKTKEGKSVENTKASLTSEPVNAVVEEISARTGTRGEITQVKVKVLSGRNEGKSMRRNVRGSVRIGDLLILRESEIEARRVKGKITKGAHS